MRSTTRSSPTFLLYVCLTTILSAYFAYAAVRGDLGVIERLVILSETRTLQMKKADLEAQIAKLENNARRMSDDFLDLDLLDEQARSMLGMLRSDDLVIRERSLSR